MTPSSPSRSGADLALARGSFALVLTGSVLRVIQALGDPSLWLDELWLTQNILERGPFELLARGLSYGQVAPLGFLALEKLMVLLFGGGELALRIVPLLASVSALVIFSMLVNDLLRPTGAFVATACFALNPLLISLSSVVKQYSTDALATVLILYALRRLWSNRGSMRSRTLLGAAAGALGFLSIPATIVAGAAGAALLLHARESGGLRGPGLRAAVLSPLLACGLAAGAAALVAEALLSTSMQQYMQQYWTVAGAFAPPFSEYPTWVLDRAAAALLPGWFFRAYEGFGSALEPALQLLTSRPMLLVLLGGAAGLTLIRRYGISVASAVLLPFVLALGLSRLEVYPLDPRTSAFLLPLMIVLAGATVPERVPWLRLSVAGATVALLVAILVDRHPIYHVDRTREIVEQLADRREPSEPVWAYPWAWPAMLYYGPRFGVTQGIHVDTDLAVSVESDPARELPSLLADLDQFRGQRTVWVLFTTHPPAQRDMILCYLDQVGRETDRLVLTGGSTGLASLHSYDLSDGQRWANASARTFPTDVANLRGAEPGCRPGL